MKKSLFPAALLLAILPSIEAEDSFTRYDANQDGTITYVELAWGKKVDFDKMDRNRDKNISAAEYGTPAAVESASEALDLFATPEFKLIDTDANQMLSLTEFEKTVAAMINQCDTNADNAVSLAEYQKVIFAEKEKAAAAAPKGSTPKPPAGS